MPKQSKRTSPKNKSDILSRTKLYGFELFMSTVGLLAIAFVVDYGIFSLFRHFSHDAIPRDNDEIVIFLVAAMIVWLPVATLFYLRSRGEFRISPKEAESKAHKVLVSIYMVINTVVAVGALFYVVYVGLQLAIGTSSAESNPVMRQILPGILMTAWHGWMLFAFTNRRSIGARTFTISYVFITIIVILSLFAVTVDGIRSRSIDQRRESDVSSIQMEIDKSFNENKQLPTSLEDVETPLLNNDLSEYTYKVTGKSRYKLCTVFMSDTIPLKTVRSDTAYIGNDGYTNFPDWSEHSAGNHCYALMPTDSISSEPMPYPQPLDKSDAN